MLDLSAIVYREGKSPSVGFRPIRDGLEAAMRLFTSCKLAHVGAYIEWNSIITVIITLGVNRSHRGLNDVVLRYRHRLSPAAQPSLGWHCVAFFSVFRPMATSAASSKHGSRQCLSSFI